MLKTAFRGGCGWALVVSLYASCLCASCSEDDKTKTADESIASCDCPIDWAVDNTALCVAPHTSYSPPVIFSSHLDDDGKVACDATKRFPQPVSGEPWSAQRIRSRCAGKGTLTLRVRQGKAKSASEDDCILAEQTLDFDHAPSNKEQVLADLEAWSAQNEACSRAFEDTGGYFEFRMESETLGCGAAGEKVNYVDICLAACQGDPSQPGCEACEDKPTGNRL